MKRKKKNAKQRQSMRHGFACMGNRTPPAKGSFFRRWKLVGKMPPRVLATGMRRIIRVSYRNLDTPPPRRPEEIAKRLRKLGLVK